VRKKYAITAILCLIISLLNADFESKVYSTTSIKDDFHGSRVLVVLDNGVVKIGRGK
jgi:hypothetical protein